MFIGRYYHTVEDKGRISLPKPLRETAQRQLNSTQEEPSWIVTRGLDGGLFVFLEETFQQQLADLADRTFTKKHNRDFLRLMANDAQQVTTDGQGRILLPQYLQELAQIKKQAVIVGSYQYIEIWSLENYHHYLDQLAPQAEAIAETLELKKENHG
jgi:MraZ protein